VIFLLGLIALLYAGRNRTTTVREDIHTTPTGQMKREKRKKMKEERGLVR